MHWLKHRITRKLLKIDRCVLRSVWQALNCLSIHATFATYCMIVAGASPGETKMWAAVRENSDFFTFVDHVKTVEFFSPSGSHTILVYRSYTDTKHRAASLRQQSFLYKTPPALDANVNFNSLQYTRQSQTIGDGDVAIPWKGGELHMFITAPRVCRCASCWRNVGLLVI